MKRKRGFKCTSEFNISLVMYWGTWSSKSFFVGCVLLSMVSIYRIGTFIVLFGWMRPEERLGGWMIKWEEMASCGKWSSSMNNFENVSSVSIGEGKLESKGRWVKICVVKERTCWTKFNVKGCLFVMAVAMVEVCGEVAFIWKKLTSRRGFGSFSSIMESITLMGTS